MKELMKKRQQTFRNHCIKYSRYVLNDHFVLFLLIFIGFLAVQYSQFLQSLDWLVALGSNWEHCDLFGEAGCLVSFSERRRTEKPYQGTGEKVFWILVCHSKSGPLTTHATFSRYRSQRNGSRGLLDRFRTG